MDTTTWAQLPDSQQVRASHGLAGGITDVRFQPINPSLGLVHEIWPESARPVMYDGYIIGMRRFHWTSRWHAGKGYVLTKVFDNQNQLVGMRCDITTPLQYDEQNNDFWAVHCHLNVWRPAQGQPKILGEDQLLRAAHDGLFSAAQVTAAKATASQLLESPGWQL